MTDTKVQERELTALDRCDICSAAALVVFTFLNGELMFCGHHSKERKGVLMEKSISVWDPKNILI